MSLTGGPSKFHYSAPSPAPSEVCTTASRNLGIVSRNHKGLYLLQQDKEDDREISSKRQNCNKNPKMLTPESNDWHSKTDPLTVPLAKGFFVAFDMGGPGGPRDMKLPQVPQDSPTRRMERKERFIDTSIYIYIMDHAHHIDRINLSKQISAINCIVVTTMFLWN